MANPQEKKQWTQANWNLNDYLESLDSYQNRIPMPKLTTTVGIKGSLPLEFLQNLTNLCNDFDLDFHVALTVNYHKDSAVRFRSYQPQARMDLAPAAETAPEAAPSNGDIEAVGRMGFVGNVNPDGDEPEEAGTGGDLKTAGYEGQAPVAPFPDEGDCEHNRFWEDDTCAQCGEERATVTVSVLGRGAVTVDANLLESIADEVLAAIPE